jgi:hypothetical protein
MEKAINPVSIWTKGTNQTANLFSMISVKDNLLDEARFYYKLLASELVEEQSIQIELTDGNITLGPDEYSSWDGTNEWIMNWAANKLNLTYVPGAQIA